MPDHNGFRAALYHLAVNLSVRSKPFFARHMVYRRAKMAVSLVRTRPGEVFRPRDHKSFGAKSVRIRPRVSDNRVGVVRNRAHVRFGGTEGIIYIDDGRKSPLNTVFAADSCGKFSRLFYQRNVSARAPRHGEGQKPAALNAVFGTVLHVRGNDDGYARILVRHIGVKFNFFRRHRRNEYSAGLYAGNNLFRFRGIVLFVNVKT